jgi:hypothetical protein
MIAVLNSAGILGTTRHEGRGSPVNRRTGPGHCCSSTSLVQ